MEMRKARTVPMRRRMRAIKLIWNKALISPCVPIVTPMWYGSSPKPPSEMEVDRISGRSEEGHMSMKLRKPLHITASKMG